jgi:hypothetical protein
MLALFGAHEKQVVYTDGQSQLAHVIVIAHAVRWLPRLFTLTGRHGPTTHTRSEFQSAFYWVETGELRAGTHIYWLKQAGQDEPVCQGKYHIAEATNQ